MKTSSQRTQDILRRADARRAASAAVRRRAVILAIAAGLLLFVALQLVLFIPYQVDLPGRDITRFAGSPYYDLIRHLDSVLYPAAEPTYTNNFEEWFGDLFASAAHDDEPAAPDGELGPEGGDLSGPDSSGGGYVEVTDNQTDGVIEGDLFKRTQSHIFYLRRENGGTYLSAYTIAQESSALCGRIDIVPEVYYFLRGGEMFLSEDGRTILLVIPTSPGGSQQVYTAVIAVDVSDPAHMREVGRIYVSGSYTTARKVGEDLLLVTGFMVQRNPDFSIESDFLPQVGPLGAIESIPVEDIFFDETSYQPSYTVLCRIRFADLAVEDSAAFLSFSSSVYVSQENIFLSHSYAAEGEACGEVNYTFSEDRSEIACVSYAGGGLAYRGSADVAGTVLDQYSMDESGGVLRVVTTTDSAYLGGDRPQGAFDSNAAVYAVDLSDFSATAVLTNFAPPGEKVTSVRFEGDIVWVCTAYFEEHFITDPVFRIDLSDLSNVTYADTGTIEGYSSSLVDFVGGTLLGIGTGGEGTFKAEVYVREGDAVISVAVYERRLFSPGDYKAYLIDRARGLLGMHVYDYELDADVYLLLRFDGTALAPVLELEIEGANQNVHATRACIAEGWLYVVGAWGGILAAPLPA